MDIQTSVALGKAGAAAALSMAGLGSAIGIGTVGMAVVGAWKKSYMQNKAAPFVLIAFVGTPLSQVIYGMILMNLMLNLCNQALEAGPGAILNWPSMLVAGFFGGAAMGASAVFQSKIGAAAADSLGETGKGFGNYIMALGIAETVALFIMVFIQAAIK